MGEKISPPKQSFRESAKYNRAGSLRGKVRAGAASIAHGRVTSVGTKRAQAGLSPAPPAAAPRPPSPYTRCCEQVRARRFLAPPGASGLTIGVRMSPPLLSQQIQYPTLSGGGVEGRRPHEIRLPGRRLH